MASAFLCTGLQPGLWGKSSLCKAPVGSHLWLGSLSDCGCGLLVPNSCAQWGDGWTVAVLWLLVREHPLRSQLTGSSDQTPRGIWATPSMFVSLLGRSLHKSVKENNLVVFDLRKVWRKLIKIQLMLRFCYKFVSSAHDVIWETECNAEYPWKKKIKTHRKEISY